MDASPVINPRLFSMFPSLQKVAFLNQEVSQLNKLMETYLVDAEKADAYYGESLTFLEYLESESATNPQAKRLLMKLNHFIP